MKKVLIVLVLLVAALFIAAYVKSPEYTVERNIVVAGEPGRVYPYLTDLKKWPEWTVWNQEKYPDMEVTYKGAEQGVGAEYHWTGPESGNGHLVITGSDPMSGIEYDLFFEGFPKSACALKLSKVAGGVQVTMSMDGDMGGNPLFRVVGLFVSMEDAIGTDFQDCLERLKGLVEGQSS